MNIEKFYKELKIIEMRS